jgi:hypothetical protein
MAAMSAICSKCNKSCPTGYNGHIDCFNGAIRIHGFSRNEVIWSITNLCLECLKYCHEIGLITDDFTGLTELAIMNDSFECFEYILKNNIGKTVTFRKIGECPSSRQKYYMKYIYNLYRNKITDEDMNKHFNPLINKWEKQVDSIRNQTNGIPSDVWNIIYTYW